MTLTQLEYFQAVCQYNNLTKTAEMLHVTQPTLTNAIQYLEREYGVTLFTRTKRRLRLTDEGVCLLAQANRLLEKAEALKSAAARLHEANAVIRIGMPYMMANTRILGHIAKHNQENGKAQAFHMVECLSAAAVQQILTGSLDIAVVSLKESRHEDLDVLPLRDEKILFVTNAANPLARRERIAPRDLEAEPLAFFNQDWLLQNRIWDFFSQAGIYIRPFLITGQTQMVCSAVTQNYASSLLYESMVQPENRMVGIETEPELSVQMCLIWKRGYKPGASAMALMDVLQ